MPVETAFSFNFPTPVKQSLHCFREILRGEIKSLIVAEVGGDLESKGLEQINCCLFGIAIARHETPCLTLIQTISRIPQSDAKPAVVKHQSCFEARIGIRVVRAVLRASHKQLRHRRHLHLLVLQLWRQIQLRNGWKAQQ